MILFFQLKGYILRLTGLSIEKLVRITSTEKNFQIDNTSDRKQYVFNSGFNAFWNFSPRFKIIIHDQRCAEGHSHCQEFTDVFTQADQRQESKSHHTSKARSVSLQNFKYHINILFELNYFFQTPRSFVKNWIFDFLCLATKLIFMVNYNYFFGLSVVNIGH